MKLPPNQLQSYLKRQGLAKVFLIFGDEPLQIKECSDSLRQFAREQGFNERIVLSVETGFNWQSLNEQANSLSLFASKKLIELRLANKSPGNEGTKSLTEYLEKVSPDNVLLITADKLDSSKQKTKWFKMLEQQGVVIQAKPIDIQHLPAWIAARMKYYQLQASQEVIHLIAERSEGHLLACAQEIEKLHLLHGSGHIDVEQVLEAVADSARFEIFAWVDTVLAGNTQRCVRQLSGLQQEGYDAILVAWALDKEIRSLAQMTFALKKGQSQAQVFKHFRVWSNRQAIVSKALKRHKPQVWQQFLKRMLVIDKMIKGVEKGNVWDEILRLSVQIAEPRFMRF